MYMSDIMKFDLKDIKIHLMSVTDSIKLLRLINQTQPDAIGSRTKSDSIVYFSFIKGIVMNFVFEKDNKIMPITIGDLFENQFDIQTVLQNSISNTQNIFLQSLEKNEITFNKIDNVLHISSNNTDVGNIFLFIYKLVNFFQKNYGFKFPILCIPTSNKILVADFEYYSELEKAMNSENSGVKISNRIFKLTSESIDLLKTAPLNLSPAELKQLDLAEKLCTYKSSKEDCISGIEIINNLLNKYNNQDIKLIRAKGYFFIAEFDKALEDFQSINSMDPEVYFYQGIINQNKKDYEKALLNYKRATLLLPEYAAAYLNLAGLYKQLSHFDEALENANMVLLLNQKNAYGYLMRGSIYILSNKLEAAIFDLKISLMLDPNLKEAKNLIDMIDKK